MNEAAALEWIRDVLAINDRVVRIDETRESIPEWSSLGTLVLQSRLKRVHGIDLSYEEMSKIETVREVCRILDQNAIPQEPEAGQDGGTTLKDGIRQRVGTLESAGRHLLRSLSPRRKSTLRALHKRAVSSVLSYTPEQLLEALRSLGVADGDTVLVHSGFSYSNGFVGAPGQVIDVLLEAVGRDGNLMMMSLPYTSSTYDYLQSLDCFDVTKTVSQMGLLTEIFRERKDVRRSLSPTHPILASGPKAEWILSGHENCAYACGAGTPFEKLVQLEGKIVFFDAAFGTMTFFHYIEDMYRDLLPWALYHPEAFEVPVIDEEGRRIVVFVYAFSPTIIKRRRPNEFEAEVRKRGLVRSSKVGNAQLEYVEVKPILDFVDGMVKRGNLFFYDLS